MGFMFSACAGTRFIYIHPNAHRSFYSDPPPPLLPNHHNLRITVHLSRNHYSETLGRRIPTAPLGEVLPRPTADRPTARGGRRNRGLCAATAPPKNARPSKAAVVAATPP